MNRTTKLKVGCVRRVLLLALFVTQAPQQAFAESALASDGVLLGQIEYWFVGHRGETDSNDRLLVWAATIEGTVSGTMKWWFANPPAIAAVSLANGRVSFYNARWEIWVDDELVLAGQSAGKTVFSGAEDGIWDGHGRVTEAVGRFKDLVGRQIYETGPVILGSDPPTSFKGAGAFVVF